MHYTSDRKWERKRSSKHNLTPPERHSMDFHNPHSIQIQPDTFNSLTFSIFSKRYLQFLVPCTVKFSLISRLVLRIFFAPLSPPFAFHLYGFVSKSEKQPKKSATLLILKPLYTFGTKKKSPKITDLQITYRVYKR